MRFKDERLKVIFECVIQHFIEIANNSGGVCVVTYWIKYKIIYFLAKKYHDSFKRPSK